MAVAKNRELTAKWFKGATPQVNHTRTQSPPLFRSTSKFFKAHHGFRTDFFPSINGEARQVLKVLTTQATHY